MSNMMKTCHPMHRLLRNLPTGYSKEGSRFMTIPDNKNGLFSGITNVDLWTDGNYVYYEDNNGDYVFKNGKWEVITWDEGYVPGRYVWTDGTKIYWSYSNMHKVLEGNSWKDTTWQGCTGFDGDEVWTDGTNIYCFCNTTNYVLKGDTWEKTPYSQYILPAYIWTDGTHIYHSYCYDTTVRQYELVDGKWVTKTWNGLPQFNATYIWTDGTHIYYSDYNSTYILEGDTWVQTTYKMLSGYNIWSDGIRVFDGTSSALVPNNAALYIKTNNGWSEMGNFIHTISFTINGTSYQAEIGMIWSDWITSMYNTDSRYEDVYEGVWDKQNEVYICTPDGTHVDSSAEIIEGTAYILDASGEE